MPHNYPMTAPIMGHSHNDWEYINNLPGGGLTMDWAQGVDSNLYASMSAPRMDLYHFFVPTVLR